MPRIRACNHSSAVTSVTGSRTRHSACLLLIAAFLQACGGGGSGSPPPPANRAPSFAAIADRILDEGATTSIDVSASDVDGTIATFDVEGLPDFVSIEDRGNSTWQITAEPGFDDSGEYTITLRVTDDDGATSATDFTLTITDVNRAPLLAAPAAIATLEGVGSIEILTGSDPDGDTPSFESDSLPAFVTLQDNDDGTATLELQPGYFASGDYVVTVRVVDSGGLTDTADISISVADVNRAPSLMPVGPVTLAEGAAATVTFAAADPDGDSLELTAAGVPAFGGFVDNGDGTAELLFAPGYFDSGVYSISIGATDSGGLGDSLMLAVTVDNTNRAPTLSQIADTSVDEDSASVIAVSASDADGDAIALSVVTLPSFATFTDNGDGTAGIGLQPTFADSGTYTVTVQASDPSLAQDETTFSLTVDNVNRAPTLTAIADQELNEDESIVVPLDANDPDLDTLIFAITGLPDFATLIDNGDGTGELDVQPGFDDSGTYVLTVSVTDESAATDEYQFSIVVDDVNRAPTLTPIADITVNEDTVTNILVAANDADDDAISLTVVTLPTFATFTDNGDGTANIELQPGFTDSGSYAVTVRASDPSLAQDETTFSLTVDNVNRAPTLMPVGDLTVDEDTVTIVPVAASDADGDAISLAAVALPSFAALTDNGDGTASIELQPGFTDSGSYAVTVRASDPSLAQDETTFSLTVDNVNRAPTLTPIDDVTVDEDTVTTVPISATDADGDAIALSAVALPLFATFTDNGDGTASIELQPGFTDSGNYSVTVRVSDPSLALDESTFSLTVDDVNRAPVLTALADQVLDEDASLVVPLEASDPDLDTLTFAVTDLPAFASLTDNGDGTGELEIQPDFDSAGTYVVTVSVSDDSSATDEFQFAIVVDDVNRAPVLAAIDDTTLTAGSQIVWALAATDPDFDGVTFEADGLPSFATLEDFGDNTGAVTIAPGTLETGSFSITLRAVDTGTPALTDERSVALVVNPKDANHVANENSQAGTADWRLDNPALLREIEGYASATSVNGGDIISLFVNTNAPTFTLEVFRTGWYQGLGARRLLGPIDVAGTSQIVPSPDPTTGLVDANWVNPFDLQTSNSITGDPWPTGVYLARLTESVNGKQSYIIFVVRDDGQPHDILFQLPVTTYQAYNAWGGKSVYDFNSGSAEPWGDTAGTRASHVSFDRPYARNPDDSAGYGMGAGEYLANVQPIGRIDGAGWDYNMVRWLEHEQYDVGYVTNIDTHQSSWDTSDTSVFLSQGHDEYWTWEMRDHAEAMRDAQVNLAFFASNAAYYQMRLEPSPTTAAADRVMVVYKDDLLDPVTAPPNPNPLDDYLTTVPFRYLPVPRPEETLIGVQYVLDPVDTDIIVTNPGHWVYDKTGLALNDVLEGLLGYEPDGIFDINAVSNREVLAETPVVSSVDPGNTGTSHMTIYEAASGASVFATGSLQWSWGLDDFNVPELRTSRMSAAAQQISENVLGYFGARPNPGKNVVSAQCVRIVSLSDVTDDQTFAAAEFDLLDSTGQTITKAGWSVFYFDSEETVGWDHRADYAIDDDLGTFWQTSWAAGESHPHEMQIDLGGSFDVSALRYVPRQDYSLDGTPGDYEVYTSMDCASWTLVASGTWDATQGRKIARFQ